MAVHQEAGVKLYRAPHIIITTRAVKTLGKTLATLATQIWTHMWQVVGDLPRLYLALATPLATATAGGGLPLWQVVASRCKSRGHLPHTILGFSRYTVASVASVFFLNGSEVW